MQLKRIPRRFWKKISKTKLFNYVPDRIAVSVKYRNHFLKKLDLKNPVTFNEKLQWLKLYDRRPEYTMMVDKYRAKDHIASVIGQEYIIPTLGAWKSFEEIDFDTLPNQFVLKCNHGSGDVVICRDKASFDVESAREKLTRALKADYYLVSREWPYKNVDRMILAEQYLEDAETGDARDYKFFCFDGEVKCFKVDLDRFTGRHANWYDRDRKLLPYGTLGAEPVRDREVVLPAHLDEMMKLAEKLSHGYSFMRVDFYYVNGKIYSGELTFYPASGLKPFTDMEWDRIMGSWLKLPDKVK